MAYYQLEDGSVYTAAQFKRKWPGGKVPSSLQRRMLGIKKITKKQYDDIRLGHLPKRYYRTTKSGKRVYDHRKNPKSGKTIADRARVALHAAGIEGQKTYFKGRKSEHTYKIWSISTRGDQTVLTIHIPNVGRRQSILNAVRNRAGLNARWIDESEKGVGSNRWVKYRLSSSKRNPSPTKTSYGIDTKAATRKMKPVKRKKKKTNGAIKTRVGGKNPSPVSTTKIPYRALIVGDNIDGYHVFLKDRKGLTIPTGDRRFVSLTMARKIAQKAGVPVSRQKVTKVRTLKPQAKRKNPSHRKGSLTDARTVAKNRLERMPFGSIVMVGQWLDTGKYEAKTGGGMNWKHEYFMPVEQWTSVPYKTKPGKKMVKQVIQKGSRKNPHASSMFNEEGPDWLIYAKAPGMSRFEPLDLSEGGTVKNLMYASRFPYSQEAKVDSIIAKLRKQAPQIKVEKRSATGPKKNPPPLPSTVIPAYGRDYKTAKEAKASWNAGKDWIIADMSSPWDGKPISKRDFPKGTSVTLRFANLRKVTRVTN